MLFPPIFPPGQNGFPWPLVAVNGRNPTFYRQASGQHGTHLVTVYECGSRIPPTLRATLFELDTVATPSAAGLGTCQTRPGLPVHQRGVRGPGAGCGREFLDGRPGTLPRQHFHRAAVAVARIRGRVPPRAPQRAGRRAYHRLVDRLLQRIAPGFVVGRPDVRRRLPGRLGRYCANRPGTTRAGLLTTTAAHASTMPLTSSRTVGRLRSPRASNQSEYTLFPPSDCPRNQDHVRWARPDPNNLHALIQGA